MYDGGGECRAYSRYVSDSADSSLVSYSPAPLLDARGYCGAPPVRQPLSPRDLKALSPRDLPPLSPRDPE